MNCSRVYFNGCSSQCASYYYIQGTITAFAPAQTNHTMGENEPDSDLTGLKCTSVNTLLYCFGVILRTITNTSKLEKLTLFSVVQEWGYSRFPTSVQFHKCSLNALGANGIVRMMMMNGGM